MVSYAVLVDGCCVSCGHWLLEKQARHLSWGDYMENHSKQIFVPYLQSLGRRLPENIKQINPSF